MNSDGSVHFLTDPLGDLNRVIGAARARGASRLLILAGKPLVCRIDGQLSPPLNPQLIHFSQTQALAGAILTPEQTTELDKEGAVDIDYAAGDLVVTINVFFGDGSHNFVVFL